MSTTKVTAGDCAGCRNDFYNHNNMGLNMASGKPQCWSLCDAKFHRVREVHVDQRPPFNHLPLVKRPDLLQQATIRDAEAGGHYRRGLLEMTAYITPERDQITRRYELTATDPASAHAEARRIGQMFGQYTYIVRHA